MGAISYGRFEDVHRDPGPRDERRHLTFSGRQFSAADLYIGCQIGFGLMMKSLEPRPSFKRTSIESPRARPPPGGGAGRGPDGACEGGAMTDAVIARSGLRLGSMWRPERPTTGVPAENRRRSRFATVPTRGAVSRRRHSRRRSPGRFGCAAASVQRTASIAMARIRP